jgi:archaellum component FlaG (FlaF/FlaG flagellin family)
VPPHLALLIDADVAGALTDVLRALAEAARDRV